MRPPGTGPSVAHFARPKNPPRGAKHPHAVTEGLAVSQTERTSIRDFQPDLEPGLHLTFLLDRAVRTLWVCVVAPVGVGNASRASVPGSAARPQSVPAPRPH